MKINLEYFFDRIPKQLRRRRLAKFLLALAPESKIQRVKFNAGAELYADISDRFPLTFFLTQSFDPEYLSIASAFLKNGGTYFDVGANFGFCTFGLIPLLKNTPVSYHLFEASQAAYDCLLRSSELYPGTKLTMNHCAVTDHAGSSHLCLVEGHQSASYLTIDGNLSVRNLCLDDYIQTHRIQSIEFMKLDIEGSEPAALEGANKSMGSGVVKALYFEVSQETLSRYGKNIPDFLAQIRALGFKLFFIKEIDFKKSIANTSTGKFLSLGEKKFLVSPVTCYPECHETDLLGIHQSSGLIPQS